MQADHERVLYEGRSARSGGWIRVTTHWCMVGVPPYAGAVAQYPVAELNLVGAARGGRDVFRPRRALTLAVVVVALVVAVVAIGSGRTREVWAAVAVSAAATVAITALPSVLGRFLRRSFQIWALYRGTQVLLFDTDDEEQYGQVARALIRAREVNAG